MIFPFSSIIYRNFAGNQKRNMKKQLLAVLMSVSFMSQAQVSLNQSMAPALNTTIMYYDANVPSPPFTFATSGTANTWDFASITITPGQVDTVSVLDPANIPFSSSFPLATHVTSENGEGSYSVMQITSAGVHMLGNVADMSGTGNYLPITTSQPVLVMPFPYTYGSSNTANATIEVYTTGSAVGQPLADSIHYKSVLTSQRNVIASGNMIIPSGTYPAILERSVNNSVDTIWFKGAITGGVWSIAPGSPTTSLDSAFYWYTNNSLLPWAHALYDNTGLHDVTYFMATGTTSISENKATDLNVYPNPASDFLQIRLETPGMNYIKVMDMMGNTVYSISTDMGIVNVSRLAAGTYIIHVTDSKGQVSQSRFVKK
jgi:hypothetical protein